jgi:hypothetical protein
MGKFHTTFSSSRRRRNCIIVSEMPTKKKRSVSSSSFVEFDVQTAVTENQRVDKSRYTRAAAKSATKEIVTFTDDNILKVKEEEEKEKRFLPNLQEEGVDKQNIAVLTMIKLEEEDTKMDLSGKEVKRETPTLLPAPTVPTSPQKPAPTTTANYCASCQTQFSCRKLLNVIWLQKSTKENCIFFS